MKLATRTTGNFLNFGEDFTVFLISPKWSNTYQKSKVKTLKHNKFHAGSNPTGGMLKVCDGEHVRQWPWLEIKLNPLTTNPPKMVKRIQTIRLLLSTNSLSVFDHFVGLAIKGSTPLIGQPFCKNKLSFSWSCDWVIYINR